MNGVHPTYASGGLPYASPTGVFPANSYGLYDVAENVSEWCWYWCGPYQEGNLINPRGPNPGSSHVCRGGSWISDPIVAFVAFRNGFNRDPDYSFQAIGFRVFRSSLQ